MARVRIGTSLVAFAVLLLLAPVAGAQQTLSGIAGTVRDPAGAPVAGVTVEAASPVLIEKVRTVVTDGQGQYNIVDLQPGTYSVTFKAPGSSTFKNDGVELTAAFTGTVNATRRPGNPSETSTVTGVTTTTHTRNTAQQTVVGRDSTAARA